MPVTVRTFASAGEAAAALSSDRGARYLGGGTLVMRALNEGDVSISTVVRAGDRALAHIDAGGPRVTLGAGVTYARILAERDLAFLHAAARSIGGPAVRNMGTVGGNLFAPVPFGDFTVALLALDATVTVQGSFGTRDVPLEEFARTFLAEIESLLNTQHEDRYLFAGSQTNNPAVDLSAAAYTPQAGLPGVFTADFDYYQGDTLQLAVRSAETFETSYGITADEPAFEELLRALSYMDYAGANLDNAVLEEAFTLMKSAVDGLSDIRGRIGASSKVLESAKSGHEDYLTYTTNLVSTLEDVDVAEATTRLAQDEVQLQASYLSLSRISELSLLNYLR